MTNGPRPGVPERGLWIPDPAQRNVFGIIEANPQLALKAVNLRRYGQQIIERLGGKRVHPNFAVAGGVNAPLSVTDREAIVSERETMIGYVQEAIAIAKGTPENPLVNPQDLFEAKIVDLTPRAKEIGVQVGMTAGIIALTSCANRRVRRRALPGRRPGSVRSSA